MGYVKDFKTHIANHDYSAFLKLWEEYCSGDEIEVDEICEILRSVKASDIAEPFGRHVDRILPLWKKLPDCPGSHQVLKLILDIQTTNQEYFFDLAMEYLKTHYAYDKKFSEKIRLIGLRNKEKFQGAITNYELLTHMEKGNFVFHTGGWGVGEIIDVSFVREQLTLEFDYVPGRKELSFATAFKTLVPIPKDHFLALRFGNPDLLEKKARETPVEVIRMLLRDVGERTAAEIKDELCDLVIPAAEWTRWWQNTRAKIKKDTMIETPAALQEPFRLRKAEVPHEEKLQKLIDGKPDVDTLIQSIYSFMRDFPETLKNNEFKGMLVEKLSQVLSSEEITPSQNLQIRFFLEDLDLEQEALIAEMIQKFDSIEALLNIVEILSLKKRILVEVRKHRANWKEIFLSLLLKLSQAPLRDYILSELLADKADAPLKTQLEDLCAHPSKAPEAFLWYFQKIQTKNQVPLNDSVGKTRFFEGLLILLSHIENDVEYKDLVKKIQTILSAGRFALIRQTMQHSSIENVKEFLLLASKCHSLSDHDQKIFHSLAEVVYPELGKGKTRSEMMNQDEIIWSTPEGYQKQKQKIQQLGVDIVENAKEIEAARAHGDLRENAEFKAALERRDRLQSELKLLSEQLNKARIISKEDISTDVVGIAVIVECQNKKGGKISYTLLGPWEADPEKNILSFQSKLAQTINGKKIGDTFTSQGEEYTITAIRSYL